MLHSNHSVQTYKFPSKQEATDLFCEKYQEHYNDKTKTLVDAIHKTFNEGLKNNFSDKSTSLCTSIIFALFPEEIYKQYVEALERKSNYTSSIITTIKEIRAYFTKDLNYVNQKLELAGNNPVSASPEELEAVSNFTIDYATYVASDIYSFFSHVEKLDWKSAGMPDPRLSYKEQLKHIGYSQTNVSSL